MLQGITMAVVQQARFAGGLAGYLPPCAGERQMWALKDHGTAAGNDWYRYDCAAGVVSGGAPSDLTCNAGGGGDKVVVQHSQKRGREDELERYYAPAPSSAALLPIPGMHAPATLGDVVASRMAEPATASTSGRPATPIAAASVDDLLLVVDMRRHGAEIDAIVRAECDRLRAGLEQARKRRCVALARAAARALRDREVELAAARRRAAELEERLRQGAAESSAWRDVARGNEAVAAGLRAMLDTVLLGGALAPATKEVDDEEGFGDSGDHAAAADDARSCCFVEAEAGAAAAAATSSAPAAASRWACRACGGGEASVLLLPCRHLCLCKACEPRADACPVCLAAKSGAIHVAAD